MWRTALLVGILVASTLAGFGGHVATAEPHSSLASATDRPLLAHEEVRPGAAFSAARTAAGSNVTFVESGLPADTTWEVADSANGSLYESLASSETTEINETLLNGTYNFTADSTLWNYRAYGGPESFAVTGSPRTVTVRFWLGYHLTFVTSGLPSNVTWNVSLAAEGVTQNRTVAGPDVDLWIPAGNFTFRDSSAGFGADPANGTGDLSANRTFILGFARPPVSPGRLTVHLNVPSADFYLNGVVYRAVPGGTTNFTLPPGLWTVFVTAPGCLPYYNTTTILSNRTALMEVALQPTPANPAPPLLSAFADLIVIALVAGIAILVLLYVIASRRLTRD